MRAFARRLPTLLLSAVLVAGCGASSAARPVAAPAGLRSLQGMSVPSLRVDRAASSTAPGLLFLAEKGGKKRASDALIADDRGRVLWDYEAPKGLEVTDFRAQTYRGKPVLTWWQGTISKAGIGTGSYLVYDAAYRRIASVKAGHGLAGDLHEFQLTPRGTAFLSSYRSVPYDLSGVGGPRHGFVYDSVVQEVDLATGTVVFEWHSLGHVPLAESLQANREPARNASSRRPFDYFHVNSIADGPGRTILVSGRNTSALYLVRRDGSIVWRLGGKRSDFRPAAAVKLRFQHDARFHGPETISVFDNGATPRLEPYTRPLVLHIDVRAGTARVVETFPHPKRLSSPYEGNLELLPDGGAFVGWGGVPKVTEFSPEGRVRFELSLPYGDTYRAYRLPWSGDPGGRPEVAVDGATVYASWNGKLGIARWRVLADGRPVATAPWSGLETAISLPQAQKSVRVEALDAQGHILGATS